MNEHMMQTIFVSAVITNQNGTVLMLQRSTDDAYMPGHYELPGGRVVNGESLEQALARKLKAEIGVCFPGVTYVKSIAKLDPRGPYVRVYFRAHLEDDSVVKLTKEHQSLVWVTSDSVNGLSLTGDASEGLSEQRSLADKDVDIKTTYIINSDGGSRGNPGPSASAYIIKNQQGEIVAKGGEYIGVATNNLAEYTAVLLALQALRAHAGLDDSLVFNIDSELVVSQLNGDYKIKNRDLWPIHQEIIEASRMYHDVGYVHIPRELNEAADARVNAILDSKPVA